MHQTSGRLTRRGLLRSTMGAVGAAVIPMGPVSRAFAQSRPVGSEVSTPTEPSRVALTHGDSRTANIHESLKRIEADIRKGLAGKRRVIIKPNVVSTVHQLSSTHVDCIQGIIEFIRPIFRGEIIVAESAANAPVPEGYDHYGYTRLTRDHGVQLVDLDLESSATRHIIDEKYRPLSVRVSKRLLDPDAYIISAAVMKTHDRAVVTLSLKNLLVGAMGKDTGFRWGPKSKGESDKWLVHGGPANQGIHYNLFNLAKSLRPNLAVIDGFEGMEHNGPVVGTPVDHRIAVASTDWLAADRVATELMGFDFKKVGYLTFCAQAGMGQTDLKRIEVLGDRIADRTRKYRPHDNIEQQYQWMAGV